MMKLVTILVFMMAMFMVTAEATNVRRRQGAKGAKANTAEEPNHRLLKKGKYYYNGDNEDYRYQKKKSKKAMKSPRPKCRPVVEGAEFLFEGTITGLGLPDDNVTDSIGTTYVYNGPLLEFNDDDELQALENFFISGSCQRTGEYGLADFAGSGHCSFTVTLDTGATMNFVGEAFDAWENLMAINGGSQELIGLSGSVTLIALNDDFEASDGDFFDAPWVYGEVILVYSICPEGYWENYYIANHEELPEGDVPDPFTYLETVDEETNSVYHSHYHYHK